MKEISIDLNLILAFIVLKTSYLYKIRIFFFACLSANLCIVNETNI